jgi:putative AlgH/UPF0301 family transcriptional regulator
MVSIRPKSGYRSWTTGQINEEIGLDELFNQTEAILIFFSSNGTLYKCKGRVARKIIVVVHRCGV